MPGLSGLVLDPKKNTTPGAGLGSMAGSPSTLASPTSNMGGINKPTQPSPPMGGGLNATIGNNYNDLLGGKNQALDQATRTTLNALGGQRKGAISDAAQKAARMGFAPGSPGYNQIMDQADNEVVSSGSNLLSGLAQKGLDQQTANLTGAQMFQSGMDKNANEGRALDQGDARLGLEGLRVGNETDLAGNTIRKTNSDINIDQGQLGVTKDLAGNTIRKTTSDIITDSGNLGVTKDLAGNTIRKTTSDIGNDARKTAIDELLGFNTVNKTNADIGIDQGHLTNENTLTGNTVNKTNSDIFNDTQRTGIERDLAGNTIRKTTSDIGNDAGHLANENTLTGNTVKKTEADIGNDAGHLANENTLTGNTVKKTEADIVNSAGELDLNRLLGGNTIKKTEADILNDKTVTDNQGRVITGNETKTKIDALDSIIGHPESYSAAQIAQAKAARAKLAPDGAGTGGAADPTDAANTVSTIASQLSQLLENAGKTPEEIQSLAKAQYAKIYGINLNSLLGAGATEGVVTPPVTPPSKYYDSTDGVNRVSGFSLTNDPNDPDIAKKRPGENDAIVAARIDKFRKTGQV